MVTGWGRSEGVSAAGHGTFYQLAIHCSHIFIFTSLSNEPDSTLICTSVYLWCTFRCLWVKSIFLSRYATPNISHWATEVEYTEQCNSRLTMWKFNLPTLLPQGNYLLTCTELITIDFPVTITFLIKVDNMCYNYPCGNWKKRTQTLHTKESWKTNGFQDGWLLSFVSLFSFFSPQWGHQFSQSTQGAILPPKLAKNY